MLECLINTREAESMRRARADDYRDNQKVRVLVNHDLEVLNRPQLSQSEYRQKYGHIMGDHAAPYFAYLNIVEEVYNYAICKVKPTDLNHTVKYWGRKGYEPEESDEVCSACAKKQR